MKLLALAHPLIRPAVVGDRVTLPNVNAHCVARCDSAPVMFGCLSCRQLLANLGQVDIHLELAGDQPHVIARQCGEHGWEALAEIRPELQLEDSPIRRRLGNRSRRAIVAIAGDAAANPVRRLSAERVWALAGKNATNIVQSLVDRGLLLKVDACTYELTDDGAAVAELIERNALRFSHRLEAAS